MGYKKLLNLDQQKVLYNEYHKFLSKAKRGNEKYHLKDFFSSLKKKNKEFVPFTDRELSNQIIALRRVYGTEEWPNLSDIKNYVSPYAHSFLKKAHQSALLAVEMYNKPLVPYKSEGYIVMMMIAWNALFHAILILNGNSIKYRDANYLDLRKCMKKYEGKNKKEIEANLNLLIDIRDKITHRENPAIDDKLFGYCQACLNNFEEVLHIHFGEKYHMPISLAYSIQFSKKYTDAQIQSIKDQGYKNNSYQVLDFIKEYENRLFKDFPDIYRSQNYCVRIYIVPKIVKEKSAEASIEYVKYDSGNEEVLKNMDKAILLIKENRVGGDYFKATEVCEIVKSRLQHSKGADWKFSASYHHSKAAKYFKIREGYKTSNPEITKKEYCLYEPLFKQYIYTQQWINFLVKQLKDKKKYESIMKNK